MIKKNTLKILVEVVVDKKGYGRKVFVDENKPKRSFIYLDF